ncbi:HD domain containing protein 2 [Paragonimus heterotremus]|uniref:5'-deoxynucleotidase HDDC2 n=1 Tax=Paragonimus heterotremus TaxID=100268 RepID=A0A8J4WHH9_9TREM|nr:HD domain containing protein 2 [Paragonimus heterotremus]
MALCTGAIYYSIVEGVWSTSDQSVGPMSKVKQRLLPQAFQFVNNLPYTLSSSWNQCVSVTFKALKHSGLLGLRRMITLSSCFIFRNMPRQNVVQFLSLCGRLKRTVRTGWTRHDIERPESVSDHMYRMALMATVLPTMDRQGLSVERLIKMTIVHDLAECIVGDITPHCNISKEEKLDRETKAMDQLCTLIPNDNATEIYELWLEYNAQQTPEARLCKDFDKFEMLLQAFEYEQECGAPKKLEEFFSSTLGCFSTPTVKSWVEDLNVRRQCFSDDLTATPASK